MNKIDRKLRKEGIINFIFSNRLILYKDKILHFSTFVDKILKDTCNVYIITDNILYLIINESIFSEHWGKI